MSKRSHAIGKWDFIVVDDITGLKKLRSECRIDGYGFLSSRGDDRNPQEIAPIIHEQMAAWPDPRPVTATQYAPDTGTVYFIPAYEILSVVNGVSTTFSAAPTVCFNAPLANAIWYVDGTQTASGIIAVVPMSTGPHTIRMVVVDEVGNTGELTFNYEQPGAISCVYLLDDDGTLAAMFGGVPYPTDAPDYVTAHYTLASDADVAYAMPSSLANGQDIPAAAVVGVEMLINLAPYDGAMVASYANGLAMVTATNAGAPTDAVRISVRTFLADTVVSYSHLTGPETGVIVTLPADSAEGMRVGLYYDTATGSIGSIINGVDYGYIGGLTLLSSDKMAPFMDVFDNSALGGPVVGEETSATLLYKAADIAQTFPASTVDICGTAL